MAARTTLVLEMVLHAPLTLLKTNGTASRVLFQSIGRRRRHLAFLPMKGCVSFRDGYFAVSRSRYLAKHITTTVLELGNCGCMILRAFIKRLEIYDSTS